MVVYPEKETYTVAEYLALEEQAKYRSEYRDGKIVSLAGGSYRHSRICSNVITSLSILLSEGKCEVLNSDLKLELSKNQNYVYPDAMVICDKPEFVENRTDIIKNPTLIVEVLSDSTEQFDRGKKFFKYRQLASLKEYVLVNQYEYLVEVFTKESEGKWILQTYEGVEAVANLYSIDKQVSVAEFYAKVDFSSTS